MAEFTIEIPDDKVQDVIAAFKKKYHYQAILEDGETNTETGAAFAERMLKEHIRNVTLRYLRKQAADAIELEL